MNTPSKQVIPGDQSRHRQTILAFVYLLIISIIIRLPFFFFDQINHDEGTFILMGQSILDGHLPYTDLWDFKPPLAFVFYAIPIALFGKSIVAVRLAGALCVALTSFFTYHVGKTLWTHRAGTVSATLFVFLSSLLPRGQATMTEHVALVPLIAALSLMTARQPTPAVLFFSGVLMGIASMIRLNLAYVTVILGVFLALSARPLRLGEVLKRGIAYAAGSCVIVILTYLPYGVTGYHKIWWSSVVSAPLAYAASQLSLREALGRQLMFIWETLSPARDSAFGVNALVWLGGIAGLAVIYSQWKNAPEKKKYGLMLLLVFLLGTGISIVKSGVAPAHYLIQVVPFMSLAAAAFLNVVLSGSARWPSVIVVSLALAMSAKPVIHEYRVMVSRVLSGAALTHGPAYEIAEYLRKENASGESIYMMTDHIVYWLIDAKPPSNSPIHPSNIARGYVLEAFLGENTSTEVEMAKVLAQKPKFIVKKRSVKYLINETAASNLLQETLRTQYELIEEIRGREIYRRNR